MQLVKFLLDDVGPSVCEASVHRPHRSHVWVASFTAPTGGQFSKSTGLRNRKQALLVARKWEAEARAQRTKSGLQTRKPLVRIRRLDSGDRSGLTQKEVAAFLELSERAVREIERRAFRKLRSHPLLRQFWREYLKGELDEGESKLTREEIQSLFNVTRTPEERRLIERIVRMIQP